MGRALLLMNNMLSANEIVNNFIKASDEWGGSRPQDDDITFVVIKVK